MDNVISKIRSMELPFVTDKPTLGGGNYFYHAIIQQGRREGVRVPKGTHMTLRESVCKFALRSTKEEVLRYKKNFNNLAEDTQTALWDDIWSNMSRKGVWAEGPVVQITAMFLETDIYVISASNNSKNPWLHVKGGESQSIPIVLANAAGIHYQSLLPVNNDWFTRTKVSSKDIMSPPAKKSKAIETPASTPTKKPSNDVATPASISVPRSSTPTKMPSMRNVETPAKKTSILSPSLWTPPVKLSMKEDDKKLMDAMVDRHTMCFGKLIRANPDMRLDVRHLNECFQQDEEVLKEVINKRRLMESECRGSARDRRIMQAEYCSAMCKINLKKECGTENKERDTGKENVEITLKDDDDMDELMSSFEA